MKKTKIFFLALLCLTGSDLYAQKVASPSPPGASAPEGREVKELKVGDMVPDLLIKNVLNHPDGEIRLSDLKGKLVILDFWATWCSPCINMFPKSQDLADSYKDELVIIPVTYEKLPQIEKFIISTREKRNWKMDFPFAVENRELVKYFPHQILPHYVWISPKGVYLGASEPDALTEENILLAHRQQNASFRKKEDYKVAFYPDQPLISGNIQLTEKPVIAQSAITSYIPGVQPMFNPLDSEPEHGVRYSMYNLPLKLLFRFAFWQNTPETFFGNNRMSIEVSDKSKIDSDKIGIEYMEWLMAGNGFCYELILPESLYTSRYKIMQEDMKRFFPQYILEVDTRTIPSYAIVSTSHTRHLKSEHKEPEIIAGMDGFFLRNLPIDKLIAQLNVFYMQRSPKPIIDLSGIDYPIDISLRGNLTRMDELQSELQKFGLDIVEGDYEVELLIIKDNPEFYQRN